MQISSSNGNTDMQTDPGDLKNKSFEFNPSSEKNTPNWLDL